MLKARYNLLNNNLTGLKKIVENFSEKFDVILKNAHDMVYLLLLLRTIQGKCPIRFRLAMIALPLFLFFSTDALAQLKAGVAKTDITNRDAGLVNDPLYAKALVLDDGRNRMVIITLDVVAIEEIGPIRNG